MEQFGALWAMVKPLLLLSHGQASVERGFSVNRQVEVENLIGDSFLAERLIRDHIYSVGGIKNVEISKSLLPSAASARQRYTAHLEDQRKAQLSEGGLRKRKNILDKIDIKKEK